MLRPIFSRTAGAEPHELGSFDALRIEHDLIRGEPGGPVLARHAEHSWEVRGQKYFRVDCAGPVLVHLEDEDGETRYTLGPYQHFSCADGIAYADRNFFASFAESTGLWYCHHAEGQWAAMRLEPAGEDRGALPTPRHIPT